MVWRRSLQTVSLGLVLAACTVAPALAQDSRPTYADRRLAVAFEAGAVVSPRDDIAFFNYTDYELNALRVVRLRLMAEWRAASTLSFVSEVRTEIGVNVDVPALYARWRPWADRGVSVQAGRVPPLIGAFPRHAYGHANVVIGWPLAYQYLVSLRPDALPATVDDLLRMRGRGWQPSFPIGSQALRPGISVVSAATWDTGVQVIAKMRAVTLAGAVTEGPPSRPSVRDRTPGLGFSGRASFALPVGLVIGASGGTGTWIDRQVLDEASLDPEAASQHLVGVDAEAGRGHWLIRTEWFYSAFTLPLATAMPLHLGAHTGYVEGRYRFSPRWQFGARVERLRFADVQAGARGSLPWDAGVDRVEAAVAYRATTTTEIKVAWQHNWRDGGRVHERGYPAIQLLYWYCRALAALRDCIARPRRGRLRFGPPNRRHSRSDHDRRGRCACCTSCRR